MIQNTILPDDPRLTAYALDEMAPAERAEFEKQLQQDAAAIQMVADIRATAAELSLALSNEPLVIQSKPDLAQAAIIPGGDPNKLDGGQEGFGKAFTKTIKFPQLYFMISGLAAACFAVFFVYWQKNQPLHEQRRYIEMPLTAANKLADAAPLPAAEPLPESQDESPQGQGPSLVEQSREISEFKRENSGVGTGRSETERSNAPAAYIAGGASAAGTRTKVGFRDLGSPVGLTAKTLVPGRARQDALGAAHSLSFGYSGYLKAERANTEAYGYHKDNDYQRVVDQPLSTFSVDVDTASYANVRRFLVAGQHPPVDAVRIEELVNYFPYNYAGPRVENTKDAVGGPPFAAHLEVADAPWATKHRLVRIGLKGREVSEAARPAANLVFLLDVSGSMNERNKLPLVKESLRMLVNKLRADDRVAIAVYAGGSGLALPSTSASHKAEILEAIDQLEAHGSTNGAMGIQLAYDIAKANFIPRGVNRVILATDGDFNVGTTSEGELVRLVGEKAKSGVFLSVLGFGMGNLKDSTLEQLADKGNGNYAYIDSLAEAKKTLVEQAGGTLVTIAKDVKVQVEFNPAVVQAYRLIGYENRLLAKEDFNNDQIDAGEIGAGHTVTALYEVVPVGIEMNTVPGVDPLKYQKIEDPKSRIENQKSGEMLTVKIRYKDPAGDVSNKLEFPLYDNGEHFDGATADFKFASAVAAFGMVLRDSPHKGTATLADITQWGRAGLGSDAGGYRNEFLGLVERSGALLR